MKKVKEKGMSNRPPKNHVGIHRKRPTNTCTEQFTYVFADTTEDS